MPPNPQPSPWICAPIPYCLEMCFPNQSWSRNGISASSDRNSVADAWGRGSAQNDDIKELCRKGGGSSHCLPNSLWLSLLDVQIQFVHFPNPPPTTSLWTPGKTKPPGLPHISPGFSALGEHLYWSLPTSLFFKEIHFSATLVKFFYTCSTPLPPPPHTHAHWMWCLPPWIPECFESWVWHSSNSAFWSCLILLSLQALWG